MRFLVDENLPIDVGQILAAAGHGAVHVNEIGMRGASDREVWANGANNDRVLISRDLDFPMRELPKPPGLILLRLPDFYTREHIRAIVTEFSTTVAFDEVVGRITVVSPGRVRTRSI